MRRRAGDLFRRFPGTTVGALGVLLTVVWFLLFPADASVTSDDGAYMLEVAALEEGGWSVPHVLSDVDADGAAYPYQNSSITSEGWFPGARHAVWVNVLAASDSLGGLGGVRAVPAMGLVLAIAATAMLSRRANGREVAGVAALLVLFSPLLFDSLQLWAHAPVAGAIAASMAGALAVMSGGARWTDVLGAVVGLAVASALRGDGFVFALAVAGVVGLSGLRSRRPSVVAAGAVFGATAVAAYGIAARYAASIVGSAEAVGATSSRGGGSSTGRLSGLVQTFFSSSYAGGAFVLLVASFALTIAGIRALRRDEGPDAGMFFGLAALVFAVRMVAFPTELASGLFGAWPLAAFAFARPWKALGENERRTASMLGLAAVGIALTQYDGGGGLNWGGRFVSAGIPGVAVLAAHGLHACRPTAEERRNVAYLAIGGLALAVACASLVFDGAIRSRHDRIIDELDGMASVPVVTRDAALPRLAWRTYPERDWVHVPDDDDGGAVALRRMLRTVGIGEVIVFGVEIDDAETLAGRTLSIEDTDDPVLISVG